MNNEFQQFTIPDEAFDTAKQLVDGEWFANVSEAGIFAAAYAIRKHFNSIDPGSLYYPGSNHNYNYQTFDSNGDWEKIIRVLYKTDTPRAYFRNLIIWGLLDIKKQLDENGLFQLPDYF